MSEDYPKLLASNLKRFRRERGLAQSKLAELAGVSLPCVKKLEGAKVAKPEAATLAALAGALRVAVGDFFRAPKTLASARFRANASLRPAARDYVVSSCATWIERYCFLEDALERRTEFCVERPKWSATFDPAEYAETFRRELGFDDAAPIASVADVLAKCGVKFWFSDKRPAPSVFGLAISESPQATGVVVFNAPDVSVERRVFSTIHELGHLLLHEHSFDANVVEENADEEREADAFAGRFLMPRRAFLSRWRETAGLPFVDRVLIVKRLFRVSYRTVCRRLVEEGLESANVYRRFAWEYRNETGKDLKNHREPAPLSRFDAPPDGFRRLVFQAVREEQITLSKAAEFLGTTVPELYESFKPEGNA